MSTATHPAPHQGEHHATGHAHPGTATYIKVGAVLGVLTLIEIAIPAWNLLGGFGNAALVALAALKFGIVVAFYMHLKFDSPLFVYIFGFGLFIAVSVITALMFLFSQKPLPPTPPPFHHDTTHTTTAPGGH